VCSIAFLWNSGSASPNACTSTAMAPNHSHVPSSHVFQPDTFPIVLCLIPRYRGASRYCGTHRYPGPISGNTPITGTTQTSGCTPISVCTPHRGIPSNWAMMSTSPDSGHHSKTSQIQNITQLYKKTSKYQYIHPGCLPEPRNTKTYNILRISIDALYDFVICCTSRLWSVCVGMSKVVELVIFCIW
jgi:hypothetical protein